MEYTTRIRFTPSFRRYCFNKFSAIAVRSDFCRFFRYLFTTPLVNQFGPGIVAHRDVCAWAQGKQAQLESHHYSAIDFLQDFSQHVVRLEILEYCSTEKRARAVVPQFDEEFLERLEQEDRDIKKPGPRVYFDSGEPVTQRSEKKLDKQREQALFVPDVGLASAQLINYMNGQTEATFASLIAEGYDEAMRIASALPNPQAREQEQRKLKHILENPKPSYAPSEPGNTIRIFEPTGISTLSSPVRKPIIKDCVDMDLKSSQLAIGSTLWRVPSVARFLEQRGDIWQSFDEHMELDRSKMGSGDAGLLKGGYKTTLYATCFGKQEHAMERELNQDEVLNYFKPGFGTHFLKHPLVRDLLVAREAAVQEVLRAGRGVTCVGKVIEIDRGLRPHEQKRRAYSILAQQAQAVEFTIVVSILPIFLNERKAKIVAWLHDGATIAPTDLTRKAYWFKQCQLAVYHKAKELGIPTYLEWTNRPTN